MAWRRAAAWFEEQGCGPVQAVMSDNAKCYSPSHMFRDTLADLDGADKIGRLHLAEALSYRALAEDLKRAA